MNDTHGTIQLRGFFRLQITEDDGKVVADSGWCENQITNDGLRNYIINRLGSTSSSPSITHAVLGTGGMPASNTTTLAGETGTRIAVTTAAGGSTALQLTATFASNNWLNGAANVANIGLFNSSSGGTLFAGNTYTTITYATNQSINMTYNIAFNRTGS